MSLDEAKILVVQGLAGKAPRVNPSNDHWEVWDNDTQAWVDTNVIANGRSPYIDSDGYWVFFDDIQRQWYTTNVKAQGPQGEEGFSPSVVVSSINLGHRVTITDADGQHSFDVLNGSNGSDGYSPTVAVSDITDGHRVTITDKAHPHGQSFDVMDGEVEGAVRFDETQTLTDAQKNTACGNIGAIGRLEYDAIQQSLSALDADISLKADEADLPTKVSDLENDTGYITASQVPAAPVQSVNGKTGAVTLKTSDLRNDSGFITAQDVPAAPVQSVNSKTGAVTVREVPDAGGATVGQVLTKTADGLGWTTPAGGGDLPDYSHATDGQVLTKTQYGPRWADSVPSSGAALRLLYDGTFGPDDPDLMLQANLANLETGAAICGAIVGGKIGSATLVDATSPNDVKIYNLFAYDYVNDIVVFARTESNLIRTATLSGTVKSAPVFGTIPLGGLPTVTAADNGKILKVVNGVWTAVAE